MANNNNNINNNEEEKTMKKITTKTAKNGAILYYADGKRISKDKAKRILENETVTNNKEKKTMKKVIIVVEKETLDDINAEVISTVKGTGIYCEVLDINKVKCYSGNKDLRTPEAWDFETDKVTEIVFNREVFDNLRNGYAAAVENIEDSVFEQMNGKVLFCRPFQMHGLAKRLISLGFKVISVPYMREKAVSNLKATGKNVYEVTAYKQFFAHCKRTGSRFEDVRKQPYVIKDMLQYVGAGRNDDGKWIEGSYKAQILLANEDVKFNRDATFIEVHGVVLKNYLVRAVCYLYVQADTEQAAMKVVDSWTKKVYGDKAIFSASKKLEGLVTRPMVKELTYKKILSSVAIETGNRFLFATVDTVATTTTTVDTRIAELEAKVAKLEQLVETLMKGTKPAAPKIEVVEPATVDTVSVTETTADDDTEDELRKFAAGFNPSQYTTTWDGRKPLPLGDTVNENDTTQENTTEEDTPVVVEESEVVAADDVMTADTATVEVPDVIVDEAMAAEVSMWLSVIVPNRAQVLSDEEYAKELADYEAKVKRGATVAAIIGVNGQKLRNSLKKAKICRMGKVFDVKVEDNKIMVVPVQNQPWQQLSFENGFQLVG